MPKSQNGWPANNVALTASYKVTGTTRALRLVKGPAGELLALVAAWIDKNIETIDNDKELDDWGYAERPIRGSTTTLSNHASGTAEDLNATQHPLGVVGTWSAAQRIKINNMLNKLGGTVRWGDNYTGRKDGMHFEINVPPTAAGLKKINAALGVMRALVNGTVKPTPPPVADKPGDGIDMTVVAASIRYGANGGYFRAGQSTGPDSALADIKVFLAWWLRLNKNTAYKAQAERDVRVWEGFIRASDWKTAGLQLTGIIKNFQRRYGLVADGVFGAKSAAIMQHDNFVVVL